MRSGWLRGSIYRVLLFWDRFSVSNPLSQIQRRTLFFLHQASYTPSFGGLGLNLLASLAELELELIRERVKAGMDRARKQGHRIGRPRVTDRRGFKKSFRAILERLSEGDISRRRAATELGIGYATLKRLLDARISPSPEEAV